MLLSISIYPVPFSAKDPGCNDDKLRTPYDSLSEYDKNYSVTIPEQPDLLISFLLSKVSPHDSQSDV